MIDQGGSIAGLEGKVSNRKITYRNGPPLIVSLGGLVAILSFAAGFFGITLGGIVLSATAIAALVGLAVVTMRLGMLPSLIIEQTLRSASEILFAPFGASDREEAFRLLRDYLLNRIPPILIITDGKIDERSKDSIIIKQGLRGPGNVQIDGASAVLLDREGIQRVLTSGSHFLDPLERVRGFVNLQLHQTEFPMKNVFTKDNIPLELSVALQYRIQQDSEMLLRRNKYTPSDQAVKTAILAASDWKAQVETTARGKIRDMLSEYYLNCDTTVHRRVLYDSSS